MIVRVSSEKGTAGMPRVGRASGSLPSSPTVGTPMPPTTHTVVSSTIAISGAGTALVTLGIR
jgi:hypothetical protein